VPRSLELSVWLGLAVFALVSAQFLLWRTRYALAQARRDALVQGVRLAPVAVLASSAMSESAASGVAS
jgi:hypothetical protein